MSIRGSNFENQHPFASDHALVWERCIPDGLLYGVDMSFTPTLFTIGTGFMLVAGRMFEITAAENISISPGSGYARVYVAIDTGGAATENSFNQVTFGVDYAANLDSFAELTQEAININQGAAVYQAEVAVLSIDNTGATAIERQMELVSPSAGSGAFAAIAVTYPAGSTVTVTDGKITYTSSNTSGAALFIIPYAATWTVTATDGTETATETIEITAENQIVSVTLAYSFYVYNLGDECVDVSGGWVGKALGLNTEFPTGSVPKITKGPTTITATGTAAGSNTSTNGLFYAANKIDLTKVKSIEVKFKGSATAGQSTFRILSGFGTYMVDTAVAGLSPSAANTWFVGNVDTGALTGEFYLGFNVLLANRYIEMEYLKCIC